MTLDQCNFCSSPGKTSQALEQLIKQKGSPSQIFDGDSIENVKEQCLQQIRTLDEEKQRLQLVLDNLNVAENQQKENTLKLSASASKIDINCDQSKPFHGVLHWIATNGGQPGSWKNPIISSEIAFVTSHPKDASLVANLADPQSTPKDFFWGDPHEQPNMQYLIIDLKERSLLCNQLTLRHGFGESICFLQDWEFAGSNDAVFWTTLSSFNGPAFSEGFQEKSWPIQCNQPFRYFRILQRQGNSSRTPYLCLNLCELFGQLSM
eukprot:TRINITY_DN8513_c0_g2_i1.p1 TRINITY_DN8513_c0_g2~~TRINITY_DN8513_c0_g2_i1.p1  ORF type:complete len:264 (-),score=50.29 TRINITY_DN8513_c0_g2_i1:51-842(-)